MNKIFDSVAGILLFTFLKIYFKIIVDICNIILVSGV